MGFPWRSTSRCGRSSWFGTPIDRVESPSLTGWSRYAPTDPAGDDDDEHLELVPRGQHAVVLDMPWAVSPAEQGLGGDPRRLGVCLHGVTLSRVGDERPAMVASETL
jgi:hypothetical protein